MKLSSNAIILVVTLLLVAGGVWYFFFSGGPTQAPLSADASNPAQTKFAVLVSQLQPIKFDTSVFQDPNFMALVDLSTPVTPESSGRLDPFAPLR